LTPPQAIGGVVTKGISPHPRAGNSPPRICETAAGMLNSIGLENVGLEAFARHKLLDLLGDLALTGLGLQRVSVEAAYTSHKANVNFAKLLADHSAKR